MLHAHAEFANLLRRLDEGAADIVIADDAELERMPEACAKPIAAGTPESGTGTTTSASDMETRGRARVPKALRRT